MARTAKQADEKDQKLLKLLKERLQKRRWTIERNWWGNILYLMGVQWVVYDINARRWRQRKLSPAVPTPITNLFRATLDTVKSALAQHDPRFLGTPERDDPHAVAAAQSADTQLQILLKEGNFRRAKRRMLDWLMPTGNAFIEPVWDDSEDTGLVSTPKEQCMGCLENFDPRKLDADEPECPKCGGQLFQESEDPNETVDIPRGRMRMDVLSPFEMYLDPAIEELEDQPFLMVVQTFTTEQVAIRWDYEVDQDNEYDLQGGRMKEAAASISSPGIGLPMAQQGVGDRQSRVTVYRLLCKYHEDYPEGLYLVMTASGKVLEKKKPYPFKRKGSGLSFYPMVHFRFGCVGGRSWGYTPADDLLPKQYQLNKAESLFTMIMSRMANPVWLIPTNTNPTRITGEIGIQIEYTPSGGHKPERAAGMDAPQSLVKYIADIRQSFDELSGAFAAMRGRPTGTRTPVGTTQIMNDRSFGRWATVFDQLEEGYTDLARNALEIWRENARTPRVQAIKNAIGGYTFHEFLAADWDDGVDIAVEAGSTRPKSQQEKLQTYEMAIQSGLIDITDQAQRIKILEDTGLSNLLPGVEEDTQSAYKENADFMQWASGMDEAVSQSPSLGMEQHQAVNDAMNMTPIMVHPLVDNHAVHFLSHRRLCLSEEFKNLSDAAQSVMFQHMMTHQADLGMNTIQTPPPPIAAPGGKPVGPAGSPSGGPPHTGGAE